MTEVPAPIFILIMDLITDLFILGVIVRWALVKLRIYPAIFRRLELTSEQWFCGAAMAKVDNIVARIHERSKTQVEMVDQFVLLAEDLIRLEPERAETLEVARLELLRYREDLSDLQEILGGWSDPLWRQVPSYIRAKRKLQRRDREDRQGFTDSE